MESKISIEQLRENNGQDGRPTWVAHQGKVYDVSASKMWRNGQHIRRHNAGQDLTTDISDAPHSDEVFGRELIRLVGELEPAAVPAPGESGALPAPIPTPPRAEKTPPTLVEQAIELFWSRHPHPLSVHFPIAYVATIVFFLALFLITNQSAFESAAYYMLWANLIMTVVAASLGLLTWVVNYGRNPDWKYKAKIALSGALFVLTIVALVLKTSNPAGLIARQPIGWVYLAVVVLGMFPVVAALGWIGDDIMYGK